MESKEQTKELQSPSNIHMKKSISSKRVLIIISLMILGLFTNIILADCADDTYIPLSYPNDYKGSPRTADDPINTGLIWIPKEACGKEVDLLITLHGWRDLKNSGDSIYLTPPAGTFSLDYIGQQTTQKEFDKIVREYIDGGKSRPIIIAAPMHDRGPDETVFTPDAYNINTHIEKIKQKLAEKGITVQIKTVSIMGHSNANCGGSLRRSAKELSNYPLYIVASADGTCESSDYVSDILPFIKQQPNAILFHMHQGRYDGDKSSAASIKALGGAQDSQAVQSEYTDTWKSSDNKFYTYLVKGAGHSHTDIPMVLLKEILPRFFPPTETAAVTQPIISKGQAGASGAGKVIGGTTLQKVSKDVPGCLNPTRCREIDQAWDQKVSPFIGIGVNQVWDHQTSGWKKYDELYFEYKAVLTNSPAGTTSGLTGTTIASLPTFSGTGPCFNKAISSSKEEALSKLKTISFQGKSIQVNRIIAPLLTKINQQITDLAITYNFKEVGSFNWRCVCSPEIKYPDPEDCHTRTSCTDINGKIQLSKHSYGLALDINAQDNPYCTIGDDNKLYRGGKECPIHDNGKYYDIPEEVITIFKANDFRWGGEFSGAKDLQHFDWQGNIGDFNGDGTVQQCPQGTTIPSSTSTISTFTPAQQIKEIPSGQGNVKVYTYQSNCPQAKTQSIIYSTLSSSSISYFYIHGDDDASTTAYCTGTYKLCERAAQQPGSLFIGLSINHRTQDKIAFKCLYEEAQNALKSLDIPMPPATILAGFSWGGRALQQIYSTNQQPPQVEKTIFFDACFNGLCQPIAKLPSSTRGELLMYASSSEQGTQVQQNIKNILKTSPENVKGIFVPESTHGSIPNLCFNDHLNSDKCDSKGQSIT